MHIVTLTTCFNRRINTLSSLKDLHKQELPEGVFLSHVLVDDGSTDGTVNAIKNYYPNVEIINGTGYLYWAGGMRYAWDYSVSKKSFDYLFVYNDDIHLYKDAIQNLLISANEVDYDGKGVNVIVGSFSNSTKKYTTYGGLVRNSWHPLRFELIPAPIKMITVDTLNMNGVLISSKTLNTVGFLSSDYIHKGADFEYGLKLRKKGGKVWVVPGYIGTCERNSSMGTSDELGISKIEKIKRLTSLKEQPLLQRAKYYKKYAGSFWFFLWLAPYFKAILINNKQKV